VNRDGWTEPITGAGRKTHLNLTFILRETTIRVSDWAFPDGCMGVLLLFLDAGLRDK
jgi:hypothetical protein